MFLGRVIGTVVATRKVTGLQGIRFLMVQPITDKGVDRDQPIVAADTTQAGAGDVVHLTSSREAAIAMPEPFVPVDHAIIAIVDLVAGKPVQISKTGSASAVEEPR
jgi:ethanolamine utilization protein EutN